MYGDITHRSLFVVNALHVFHVWAILWSQGINNISKGLKKPFGHPCPDLEMAFLQRESILFFFLQVDKAIYVWKWYKARLYYISFVLWYYIEFTDCLPHSWNFG